MQELEMKTEKFHEDEGILTPKREAELLGQIAALQEKLAEATREIANLKKLAYGQRSEKTEVILENAEQLCMFNVAEENVNKEVREREKDVVVPEHKRKSKRTHEEAFENLPVEEVIHEVEDKGCPDCGARMDPSAKNLSVTSWFTCTPVCFCASIMLKWSSVPCVAKMSHRMCALPLHSLRPPLAAGEGVGLERDRSRCEGEVARQGRK